MKGDFTRSTFKRKNHYRSVRMQQGRVQLDSDWNEQADINNYHVETGMKDVIGRCGAPFHKKTGINDIKNFEIKVTDDTKDFEIAQGHIYVNGILCENDPEGASIRGSNQPDLPPLPEGVDFTADMPFIQFRDPPVQFSGGKYLAFLDVWQRHITYLDDKNIREVALGGPDTATRAKTVWQVKLLPVGEEDVNCLLDNPAFNELVAGSTGKLSAKTTEPGTFGADPCILPSGGGYRRIRNQLYRVEIHDGGDRETATFKWSRDNGTVVVTWKSIKDENKLTVIDPGRGILSCFAAGKWVELTDDIHELWGLPGTLVRLTGVSGELFTIDPASITGFIDMEDFPKNPKVRLWDSEGAVKVSQVPGEDWVQLGDEGIQVRFETGTYRTGDYWLIPARTEKADIDWPKVSGQPEAQEPHGIKHHYCRLALLEAGENGSLTLLKDCRKLFPSLTEFTTLSYISGDGQEAMPERELPEPLKVGVSNGQWPVEGALVRFEVESGGGTLTAADPVSIHPDLIVETDSNGVAQCEWTLGIFPNTESPDTPPPPQRVKATLVDANHNEEFRLPVFFNANLSIAGQVAYFPQGCTSMGETTTVQNAIDRLSHLPNLFYAGGDGQEAMPGNDLPEPLAVGVASKCGPINNTKVRFSIEEGGGTLTAGEDSGSEVVVDVGQEGIYECFWQLGDIDPDEPDVIPSQRVKATLLDEDETPLDVLPVYFNANLSVAREVAYAPICDELIEKTTVQDAIDHLSQKAELFYVGGDGQEAMPGNDLPEFLKVGVASKCGPINDAKVKFEIEEGDGTLRENKEESGSDFVIVETGTHGVYECIWQLGNIDSDVPDEIPLQRIKATLLKDDGESLANALPVYFNASIDVAREVVYNPDIKGDRWRDITEDAGYPNTVQDALDTLVENLDSTDIAYRPGCGEERGITVRSELNIPRDRDSKVADVLNALLCTFNASHLPILKDSSICKLLKTDENVTTVQEALNALCKMERGSGCCTVTGAGKDIGEILKNLKDGDVICLLKGEPYDEDITISGLRNIVIRGCSAGVRLNSNIQITDCSNVTLENLDISGSLISEKVEGLSLRKNIISLDEGQKLDIISCTNVRIENNSINSRSVIYFSSGNDIEFSDNTIDYLGSSRTNSWGILALNCNLLKIRENRLNADLSVTGKDQVYTHIEIRGGQHAEISGNYIQTMTKVSSPSNVIEKGTILGVYITNLRIFKEPVLVNNNTIYGSNGWAVYVDKNEEVRIEGNTISGSFRQDHCAVSARNNGRLELLDNSITSSHRAIEVLANGYLKMGNNRIETSAVSFIEDKTELNYVVYVNDLTEGEITGNQIKISYSDSLSKESVRGLYIGKVDGFLSMNRNRIDGLNGYAILVPLLNIGGYTGIFNLQGNLFNSVWYNDYIVSEIPFIENVYISAYDISFIGNRCVLKVQYVDDKLRSLLKERKIHAFIDVVLTSADKGAVTATGNRCVENLVDESIYSIAANSKAAILLGNITTNKINPQPDPLKLNLIG